MLSAAQPRWRPTPTGRMPPRTDPTPPRIRAVVAHAVKNTLLLLILRFLGFKTHSLPCERGSAPAIPAQHLCDTLLLMGIRREMLISFHQTLGFTQNWGGMLRFLARNLEVSSACGSTPELCIRREGLDIMPRRSRCGADERTYARTPGGNPDPHAPDQGKWRALWLLSWPR